MFEPSFAKLKSVWVRSKKLSGLLLGPVYTISTPEQWYPLAHA